MIAINEFIRKQNTYHGVLSAILYNLPQTNLKLLLLKKVYLFESDYVIIYNVPQDVKKFAEGCIKYLKRHCKYVKNTNSYHDDRNNWIEFELFEEDPNKLNCIMINKELFNELLNTIK